MLRTAFYLLFIFFAIVFSDDSRADQSIEQEFKRKQELMKSRYRDFYIHKEKSANFEKTKI